MICVPNTSTGSTIATPVSPGGSCATIGTMTVSVVCIGGSFCEPTTQQCQCPPGFIIVQAICQPLPTEPGPIGPGRSRGKDVVCIDSICTLIVNKIQKDNGSISAEPGSQCSPTTTDCIGLSTCIGGFCTCGAQRVVARSGQCVPIAQGDAAEGTVISNFIIWQLIIKINDFQYCPVLRVALARRLALAIRNVKAAHAFACQAPNPGISFASPSAS